MKAVDILLATLTAPRSLAAGLVAGSVGGALAPAFFALAGGVLSATLGLLVVTEASGSSGRTIFSTLGALLPLVALFIVAFKTALVHLFAGLWGQKGDVRPLWVAMLYSFAPWFLLLPLALLLRAGGVPGLFFAAFLAVTVLGWRVELAALAAVYRLAPARAFALFLLPLALGAVFVLLVFLALASLVAGLAVAALGLVL